MSEELKPITAADAGFDADEPNATGILLFLGATVAMFIVVVIAVSYYYQHVREQQEYRAVLAPPSQQLNDLRAREGWVLKHYSYADKAKGKVRIPISRAMELLEREAAAGKLQYPQQDQAPKKVEPAAQTAAPAVAMPASGK